MVPITEEERNSPLYKYYIRDMVAPDPSRYEEVKEPMDPALEMCIRDSCHAVFKIPVKARLWAVIFCKIVEELLRRRGEPEFLGHAGKAVPDFEYFLF